MAWNHIESSNTRIRFEEQMQREREERAKASAKKKPAPAPQTIREERPNATPVLPPSNPPVIEVLVNAIEDQCKAGEGHFSCQPIDLLALIEAKPHGPYHPDFLHALKGGYADRTSATIRPHMASKGIDIFTTPPRGSLPRLHFRMRAKT